MSQFDLARFNARIENYYGGPEAFRIARIKAEHARRAYQLPPLSGR